MPESIIVSAQRTLSPMCALATQREDGNDNMKIRGNRRRRSAATILGVAVFVVTSALVSTGTAFATPKGAFAVFADCPLKASTTIECIWAKSETGSFTIGKKTVPLEKAQILQGGLKEGTSGLFEFVAAADGNTLPKTPQKVPGGLAGLVNCNEITGKGLIEKGERITCEGIFENGLTGVNATVELAAPASSIGINLGNLLNQEGTALSLPVKVHLENPLLGGSCYVGSNSAPIVIPLTTGTTSPPAPNKPISGKLGEVNITEEGTLLTITNNSLVNNSFAAPKSNGCGGIFEFLIAPLLDSQLGVPSTAGHNTAILNGTLKQSPAFAVREHE